MYLYMVSLPNGKFIYSNNDGYTYIGNSLSQLVKIANYSSLSAFTRKGISTMTTPISSFNDFGINVDVNLTMTIPNITTMMYCLITPITITYKGLTQVNNGLERNIIIKIQDAIVGTLSFAAGVTSIDGSINISTNFYSVIFYQNNSLVSFDSNYTSKFYNYTASNSKTMIVTFEYDDVMSDFRQTGDISCTYQVIYYYLA